MTTSPPPAHKARGETRRGRIIKTSFACLASAARIASFGFYYNKKLSRFIYLTSKTKTMTAAESLILNFEEIRRRSIKLWSGLIPEFYQWRPDIKAQSCIEMIRHVLETENIYQLIIINKGGNADDFVSPWKDRTFTDLQNELDFAMPFRKKFLETINEFTPDELGSIDIVRKEKKTRTLGDFLFRCAYHEAVHAGQFLSYLRTLGLNRPDIWD
jgi:uncharacterized damage-inducible protein DinB